MAALWLIFGEHFPEFQGLVRSSRCDIFSVRTYGQVQHSEDMAIQDTDSIIGLAVPDHDLVSAIPMGCYKFIGVRRVCNVTNLNIFLEQKLYLGLCFYRFHQMTAFHIPNFETLISISAAAQ
jgi:hypothetical protein